MITKHTNKKENYPVKTEQLQLSSRKKCVFFCNSCTISLLTVLNITAGWAGSFDQGIKIGGTWSKFVVSVELSLRDLDHWQLHVLQLGSFDFTGDQSRKPITHSDYK